MSAAADFQEIDQGGARTVVFTGSLTLAKLGDIPARLETAPPRGERIDVSGVERIDTVGAWLVHRLAREGGATIVGANDDTKHLLAQVAQSDGPLQINRPRVTPLKRVLGDVGEATTIAGRTLFGLLGFLGAVSIALWSVITHPSRFRWNAVIQRFEVVGIAALGIIGLMSFLIGIVIAQQGAVQLAQFGFESFTINLVGRITFRELGVLMTAIMVAGRSGSAFAAQIGTMKLTEEIDAMRTIGVSPNEALVLPRVLAAVLMMPLLGFYASVVAVIGGGLYCWVVIGIPPVTFVQRIREVVPMTDVYIGLIKAPVFGLIIGLSGCFQGMLVENDAEQVGLLDAAPQLLERVTTLTERLTELLSDKNQGSLQNILANVDKLSGSLADRGPEIAGTLAETRIAVRQAGKAAEQIGNLAQSVDGKSGPLIRDLQRTVASANKSVNTLDGLLTDAKPGVSAFSKQTLPEIGLLVRDLRTISDSLGSVATRLDQGGATSLIGSPKLPDYEPTGGKK